MANQITISLLFPQGVPERIAVGTAIAEISAPEGSNLTLSQNAWVDYRGITGEWEVGTSVFRIDGNRIVIDADLDYDSYQGKPFRYELYISGPDGDSASVSFGVQDLEDIIRGTASSDILKGDRGQDKIIASNGDDRLYGDAGNDVLYGGLGRDVLSGGKGEDTFMFKYRAESTVKNPDVITAWDKHTAYSKGDTIDVSGIDANVKVRGDEAFSWISSKAFTGKPGQLRYEKANGDTFVYGDVDGDRKADFAIKIDASVTLYKDDFLL
ncbi:hypothetical protein [Rhizobium sp. Root1204]|uniref:calcium-binding protein n=1 Tax=Rhizobium sp. Root1204 TaxID=1736428 RepID=UPI00071637C6|nr:hypothetical protein [Rhizobium sp. Root1204]KQV31162.1 hypothetical protein ASC96_08195 [Rhizobium sp. Root1204]